MAVVQVASSETSSLPVLLKSPHFFRGGSRIDRQWVGLLQELQNLSTLARDGVCECRFALNYGLGMPLLVVSWLFFTSSCRVMWSCTVMQHSTPHHGSHHKSPSLASFVVAHLGSYLANLSRILLRSSGLARAAGWNKGLTAEERIRRRTETGRGTV